MGERCETNGGKKRNRTGSEKVGENTPQPEKVYKETLNKH